MSSEELKQAEILKNEGKFNEALLSLNEIEERGDLSSSDLLSFHLLKGSILNIVGSYSDALKHGELAYQKSQELILQTILFRQILSYGQSECFRFAHL